MKIRQGFVSNSSSSSFICHNEELTLDDVKKAMKKITRRYNEDNKDKEYYHRFYNDDYIVFAANHDYIKDNKHWGKHYGDYKKLGVGQIVVESSDDNSIPYEVFEDIEKLLQTERNHLG